VVARLAVPPVWVTPVDNPLVVPPDASDVLVEVPPLGDAEDVVAAPPVEVTAEAPPDAGAPPVPGEPPPPKGSVPLDVELQPSSAKQVASVERAAANFILVA